MRHGAAAPALERQPWLGAVECLDLALFVDRQHHGVRRRIDIEAADIADFLGKLGIGGELEWPHPMRLQAVAAPDPLHGTDADPGAHALDSHAAPRQENPQTDSSVRFYPLEPARLVHTQAESLVAL